MQERELDLAESELTDLMEAMGESEAQIEQLQAELKQVRADEQRLLDEKQEQIDLLAQRDGELRGLRSTEDELSQQRASVLNLLEELTALKTQKADLESQNTELADRQADLETQNTELADRLSMTSADQGAAAKRLAAERDLAHSQLADSEQDHTELEEGHQAALAKIAELQQERDLAHSRLAESEQDHTALGEGHQAALANITELQHERDLAHSRFAESEQDHTALGEDHQAALAKIAELQQDHEVSLANIAELSRAVASGKDRAELEHGTQTRLAKLAGLEQDHEIALAKVTELTDTLVQFQTETLPQMANTNTRLTHERDRALAEAAEAAHLRASLEAAMVGQADAQEVLGLREQLAALGTEVRGVQVELVAESTGLQEQLAARDSELTATMQLLTSERAIRDDALAAVQGQLDAQVRLNAELEQNQQMAISGKERTDEENAQLQADIAQLQAKLEGLQDEMAAMVTNVELEAIASEHARKVANLQANLGDRDQMLVVAQSDRLQAIADLEQQLSTTAADADENSAHRSELGFQRERLLAEAKTLRRELATAQREMDRVKENSEGIAVDRDKENAAHIKALQERQRMVLELEAEAREIKVSLESTASDLRSANDRLQDSEEHVSTLSLEAIDTRQELDELRAEVGILQEQLRRTQADPSGMSGALENMSVEFGQAIETVTQQRDAAIAQQKQTATQLTATTEQQDAMATAAAEATSTITALAAEREASQAKLDAVSAQLVQQQNHDFAQQEDLEANIRARSELTAEVASLAAQLDDLRETQTADATSLEGRLEAAREEVRTLQSKNIELEEALMESGENLAATTIRAQELETLAAENDEAAAAVFPAPSGPTPQTFITLKNVVGAEVPAGMAAEIPLIKGALVTTQGPPNERGFYLGESAGHRGLIRRTNIEAVDVIMEQIATENTELQAAVVESGNRSESLRRHLHELQQRNDEMSSRLASETLQEGQRSTAKKQLEEAEAKAGTLADENDALKVQLLEAIQATDLLQYSTGEHARQINVLGQHCANLEKSRAQQATELEGLANEKLSLEAKLQQEAAGFTDEKIELESKLREVSMLAATYKERSMIVVERRDGPIEGPPSIALGELKTLRSILAENWQICADLTAAFSEEVAGSTGRPEAPHKTGGLDVHSICTELTASQRRLRTIFPRIIRTMQLLMMKSTAGRPAAEARENRDPNAFQIMAELPAPSGNRFGDELQTLHSFIESTRSKLLSLQTKISGQAMPNGEQSPDTVLIESELQRTAMAKSLVNQTAKVASLTDALTRATGLGDALSAENTTLRRKLHQKVSQAVQAGRQSPVAPSGSPSSSSSSSVRLREVYLKQLRVESHRKALVYQKRYLVMLLGGMRETGPETTARIAAAPAGQKLSPLARFRAAGVCVVAIERMRLLSRRWAAVSNKSRSSSRRRKAPIGM